MGYGADVIELSYKPLELAIRTQHLPIITKLLEYGANVNELSYQSLKLAIHTRHLLIITKLLEYGAVVKDSRSKDEDALTFALKEYSGKPSFHPRKEREDRSLFALEKYPGKHSTSK